MRHDNKKAFSVFAQALTPSLSQGEREKNKNQSLYDAPLKTTLAICS
jgi:hypothetical protein